MLRLVTVLCLALAGVASVSGVVDPSGGGTQVARSTAGSSSSNDAYTVDGNAGRKILAKK